MDDRLDIRQRRAIATSYSYPDSDSQGPENTSLPSSVSCSPFPTVTARWRARRSNAQLPLRLGMRLVEVVLLALAMFIVPSLVQYGVRSVNELNEIVGRRSQSPFTSVPGSQLLVGTLMFLGWHAVVLGLGYVILSGEQSGKEEREERSREGVARADAPSQRRVGSSSASRILGRILLPSYLIFALLTFFYQLSLRLIWPTFAVSNTHGSSDATVPPSLH